MTPEGIYAQSIWKIVGGGGGEESCVNFWKMEEGIICDNYDKLIQDSAWERIIVLIIVKWYGMCKNQNWLSFTNISEGGICL